MYGLYLIIYFTVMDILKTLLSPFFFLLLIIIYFQYSSVTSQPLKSTLISIAFGILGGIMATVSFIYLEIYLIPKDFLYILVLSVALSFLDKRLICLSYSGGLLVLLNFFTTYPKIKSFEIMIVISILHIIESVLIILNGRSQWEVNYFRQNNIIVGGLVFNRFWPIPFLFFIGDTMIRPIVLIAILSYSDFTTSSYPREKTYNTSIMIFIYSSILLLITLLFKNNLLSSILAILGHEIIIYINILKEKIRKPLYTEPYEGIRVLRVERRSIARKIGI